MPNQRLAKYSAALERLPSSGGGGCHAALLGVADYGVLNRMNAKEPVALQWGTRPGQFSARQPALEEKS